MPMTDGVFEREMDCQQQSFVRTWDLLRDLGFIEDPRVISDPPGGLSIDFGNLKLEASHVLNRRFVPAVLFTGVILTPRTIASVDCEMPREVESRELGIAWVTWCLDSQAGGLFEPVLPVDWLTAGRTHRHLLPWERMQAEYSNRPRCHVRRDWARLAFRDLSAQVEAADDDTPVIFQFDGEVMKISCGGQVVATPASGAPWSSRYSLSARSLRWLPTRLTRDPIVFSVFNGGLTIGNRRYSGVVEADLEECR